MDSSIAPDASRSFAAATPAPGRASRPADGKGRRRRAPCLLIVVAAALSTGCTSFRPVPVNAIVPEVDLGDIVRVTDRHGSRREFQVISVGADSLGGVDVTIPTEDIVFVERKQVDPARSFGMGVVGVVGGVVTVLAVTMTAALVVLIAAA